MFFKVSLTKPIRIVIFGRVVINVSPDEVVFYYNDAELKVTNNHVSSEGLEDDVSYDVAVPHTTYSNGSSVWSKEVSLGERRIRVASFSLSDSKYDVTISANGGAVVVTTFNDYPAVVVAGNTVDWCNEIIALMGAEDYDQH